MTQYHKDGTLPKSKHDVFVFGSNLAGIHGAGAAKVAHEVYCFPYHKGGGFYSSYDGLEAYGIPTKGLLLTVLDLGMISMFIQQFKLFAEDNPEKRFFVTRIGCGYAGYSDGDIAPLFKDFPENCSFADEWKPFLEGNNNGNSN